jgi:hypothetical protein
MSIGPRRYAAGLAVHCGASAVDYPDDRDKRPQIASASRSAPVIGLDLVENDIDIVDENDIENVIEND